LVEGNFEEHGLGLGFYRSAGAAVEAAGAVAGWIFNKCYREALFRSRCQSVGRNLSLSWLPDITGHPEIYVGDDVCFEGHFGVMSGRILDHPELRIGNRVAIGHNVTVIANREVVFEDDVRIGAGCRFMDSDAHPRDPDARRGKLPPPPEEIRSIRIRRGARIGGNTFVMKGVTVGEGATVGVNSVVLSDVPAFAQVSGNPARAVVTPPL